MVSDAKVRFKRKSLPQLKKELEKRTGKSTDQLYLEREKRVRDAINLKEPDRVPVRLETHAFPARYAGVPISASFYQPSVWIAATRQTILDFEPDIYQATVGFYAGKTLELLDPQHLKWPGGALPPDVSHQAVEQEYMKVDEYELFLDDPADYTWRYLVPRAYSALASLSRLPYLGDKFFAVPQLASVLSAADFQELGKTLLKAGCEHARMMRTSANFDADMADLGFPQGNHGGGAGSAPFDMMSDFYRGMRGTMLDMYRCPDKLLAACEKILRKRLATAAAPDPAQKGNPKMTFLGLHRGAEGFMSRRQFEKFYWPDLKKALLCTIGLGIVPLILCEGKYDDRVEYFLELPKGKAVCLFDRIDMFRAKHILRDHICIGGNVPSSLLQFASPNEVEEYCARLIKVCGKGGGFILSAASSIDLARPENLRAMLNSPRKYSPG